MRFHKSWFLALVIVITSAPGDTWAQPLGEPDRASYGDAMIQDYLSQESRAIEGRFGNDLASLEDFSRHREEWKRQYWDMLDRKSTRLNSSHIPLSRMPSSA